MVKKQQLIDAINGLIESQQALLDQDADVLNFEPDEQVENMLRWGVAKYAVCAYKGILQQIEAIESDDDALAKFLGIVLEEYSSLDELNNDEETDDCIIPYLLDMVKDELFPMIPVLVGLGTNPTE
jgi:hypothetical protein